MYVLGSRRLNPSNRPPPHNNHREDGARLAVASNTIGNIELYCPRTGRLCQAIPPPDMGGLGAVLGLLPDQVLPSYGVRALVRRQEEEEDSRSGQRPHFLVLYWSMVRKGSSQDRRHFLSQT